MTFHWAAEEQYLPRSPRKLTPCLFPIGEQHRYFAPTTRFFSKAIALRLSPLPKDIVNVDQTRVDSSSLPSFYQSVLNVWQALTWSRDLTTYEQSMLLSEPLFHNVLFEGFENNKTFIQKFINASITKIYATLKVTPMEHG